MITPLFFLLLLRLLSQGLPCILLAWPVFPLSLGKSLRHIPSGRRNHIALLSPPFISDMRYMASTLFIYIGYTIHLRYATIQIRMLRFLILFLLSKEPMHGQALADEIAKRKGEKPSPGTIYPALKNLRQAGFIREENKDGKTIVYALTPRGEGALKIAKRRFTRTFLGVFP